MAEREREIAAIAAAIAVYLSQEKQGAVRVVEAGKGQRQGPGGDAWRMFGRGQQVQRFSWWRSGRGSRRRRVH